MNKSELVAAVAEKAGIAAKDADAAVGAVFDTIQATMAQGNEVRLVGFGSFGVSHRAASKGPQSLDRGGDRPPGPQRRKVHLQQGAEGRRQF